MDRRPRFIRLAALAVVATLPVFGLSAVASAAKAKAGPNCVKHPHKAKCASGGGGATGGTGGTPPNIIVSVSPDPVQETGTSQISAIVQVEALPIFAGQTVDISSQQLFNDCAQLAWNSFEAATAGPGITGVALDNEGNASLWVVGEDCAPGPNLIEADLNGAPYTTATATLTALPPAVTKEPTITGAPNPEVETGDGTPSNPESQVYGTFLIEENPVYAEQTVDVESTQLFSRCGALAFWDSETTGPVFSPTVAVTLDNDGNAEIGFFGTSCAAGDSLVTADLVGGTHDTFSTTFTISPPAVTDI